MAMTLFALGACLGAWLGSAVAGDVAQRGGWRAAFLALGIPGLLIALLVRLTVREPRRGRTDHVPLQDTGTSIAETLRYVFKHRSALHLLLGGAVATLWSWGLMWWIPTFLVRSHHMTVGQAGDLLGPMHLVAGTLATLLASWLMSRPAAADPGYVTRLLAVVTAVTTLPSLWLLWTDSFAVTRALLWIFVPSVYLYIGPILGLLQNVVPARMRATTCALLLFAANVANLVIAPQLVGILSDGIASAFNSRAGSLRWALLLLAPTGFWAAAHLAAATRSVAADQAAASN
jgi:sugar phosphate permease